MTIPLDRFYPIIDSGLLARAGLDPVELGQVLVQAGARLVQYRHKADYSRVAYEQAKAIGGIVQQAGGRYIINDRFDIALMLGADGVHLGQDDLPPAAVRQIAGDKLIIGFSTHNEEQLRAGDCEPVDYLAIGPVFGTTSKQNPDPVLGLEELRRLRPVTEKPLVAIGGITRARAAKVLETGVDSLAVLSDLIGDRIPSQVNEWIQLTHET
jgi:thiamine-phosphate pyrophosphorylase